MKGFHSLHDPEWNHELVGLGCPHVLVCHSFVLFNTSIAQESMAWHGLEWHGMTENTCPSLALCSHKESDHSLASSHPQQSLHCHAVLGIRMFRTNYVYTDRSRVEFKSNVLPYQPIKISSNDDLSWIFPGLAGEGACLDFLVCRNIYVSSMAMGWRCGASDSLRPARKSS